MWLRNFPLVILSIISPDFRSTSMISVSAVYLTEQSVSKRSMFIMKTASSKKNDVFRNDISVSVNEAEINQLDERVAVFYAGPSAMYEDSDSDTDRAVIGLGDPNGYMAVWAEEYLGENL